MAFDGWRLSGFDRKRQGGGMKGAVKKVLFTSEASKRGVDRSVDA